MDELRGREIQSVQDLEKWWSDKSETEAFLVSSTFPDSFEATPQPLRVRTYPPFSLVHAVHSALTLTLLHYGSERPPRLPVTTFYADKISKMTSKGLRPKSNDGSIPFWI